MGVLLTGAAFGGTKLSISFLVMRPSGPEPEQKTALCIKKYFNIASSSFIFISAEIIHFYQHNHLHFGDLPLTCARSIPFSAASFLASGLANTRPFLGAAAAAGGAAAGLGAAAAGAAIYKITQNTHK